MSAHNMDRMFNMRGCLHDCYAIGFAMSSEQYQSIALARSMVNYEASYAWARKRRKACANIVDLYHRAMAPYKEPKKQLCMILARKAYSKGFGVTNRMWNAKTNPEFLSNIPWLEQRDHELIPEMADWCNMLERDAAGIIARDKYRRAPTITPRRRAFETD